MSDWLNKQSIGKSFRLSLVFGLLLILVKYLVVAHIPYYHFVFLLVSVWFYCLRTKVSLRYGCFNGLNRVFGKIMLKISKFTKNFKKPKKSSLVKINGMFWLFWNDFGKIAHLVRSSLNYILFDLIIVVSTLNRKLNSHSYFWHFTKRWWTYRH